MNNKTIIELPNVLLVGAAGRNAGKTEFVCRIINEFLNTDNLIGVKITAINRADGTCPRGGEGCGVCSSLKTDYAITEETDATSTKDTSRLLAAGAKRVLWLRVLKSKMHEGINALRDAAGPDSMWVCESNSIRKALKPSLFFMIQNTDDNSFKDSARQVKDYADLIVHSDPSEHSFDFDFNRLAIEDRTWTLKENASAVILAGGKSSRMETDKSLLPINGQPMIQHIVNQVRPCFQALMISTSNSDAYQFLNLPRVIDPEPDRGPLMGLAASLAAASHDYLFVSTCDVPELNIPFVRSMLREATSNDWDAVVPRNPDKHIEPLHAVYHRRLAPLASEILKTGEGKIRMLLDKCRVKYFDMPSNIKNLNTIEDYEEYCTRGNRK